MTLRRVAATAVVLATLITALPAAAQMQMRSDSISRDFFAPRFVLANGEKIGLTEDQRAAIQSEAEQAAEGFVGLRFDLDTALRQLIGIANRHPVDEDTAVAQLEQILDLERQIKVLQLRMVLRAKNLLTSEQQDALRQIRREARLRGER